MPTGKNYTTLEKPGERSGLDCVDQLRKTMDDRRVRQLRDDGLYRRMVTLESASDISVQVAGRRKILFCSNNYLGLAQDARLIEATKSGLEKWGFGSGSSRLICGNTRPHESLQNRLAGVLNKEKCLIFPTGFMANYAALATLPGKGDLLLLDKLDHASLIDGGRASQGTLRTFPHRQTEKLIRLLETADYEQAWIVTDSLFSMDGDRAHLAELIEIKKQFNAKLLVDEAHAIGCLGPRGLGVADEEGVLDEVDIYMATFSKALGGAGGFIAASSDTIEWLVNSARAFIFTTGIPVVNCLAAEAALDIIDAEPQRRQRLNENAEYFHQRCSQMKLDTGESVSHIVPIHIGSAEKAQRISEQLWEKGLMVPAIRPPTVAPNTSRLRVSLSSQHSRDHLDILCDALQEVIL